MMRHTSILGLLASAVALATWSTPTWAESGMPLSAKSPEAVLLAPWTGPYGGVPPFDRARVDLLAPALETAMAAELAETDALAANPEPATFENTIVALERAGRRHERVRNIYGIYK